jgi:hypothetical protein
MKVSLKKAFSILDGRLSTKIEDVYEMLNYIFDENFMTHQLPIAIRKLNEVNPEWFQNAKNILNDVKRTNNTDDFEELMTLIDEGFPTYQIELGKVDAKIDFLAGLV